jgi:hypothetical protein
MDIDQCNRGLPSTKYSACCLSESVHNSKACAGVVWAFCAIMHYDQCLCFGNSRASTDRHVLFHMSYDASWASLISRHPCVASKSVSLLRRPARGVGRVGGLGQENVDLASHLCGSVRRVHVHFVLPPAATSPCTPAAASSATRERSSWENRAILGYWDARRAKTDGENTSYRCAGPLILTPFPPVTAPVLPNLRTLGNENEGMLTTLLRLRQRTARAAISRTTC